MDCANVCVNMFIVYPIKTKGNPFLLLERRQTTVKRDTTNKSTRGNVLQPIQSELLVMKTNQSRLCYKLDS